MSSASDASQLARANVLGDFFCALSRRVGGVGYVEVRGSPENRTLGVAPSRLTDAKRQNLAPVPSDVGHLRLVRYRKELRHVLAVLGIVQIPVGILVVFGSRLHVASDQKSADGVGDDLSY